jgi:16S rRNA (cytosine967-C5)-methyltransferase
MIAAARRSAYDALRSVTTRRRDLSDALADTRTRLSDDRDRALAAAILTGTLRWQNRLDWLLAKAVARDLPKLDPEILDILRLSLFQLLFLTRVPASAVVDDAVSLAKAVRKSSASGLVNAVLRRIARTRHQLDLPSIEAALGSGDRDSLIEALTVTGSHPQWLAERWADRLGAATAAAWVAFNNEEPPFTLRANTLIVTREQLIHDLATEDVVADATRFAPDGVVVGSGNPLHTSLFGRGQFVVQDEASQLVTLMAGRGPRRRVLDACAAPGGKTLALASVIAPGGLLVASDISPRRLDVLRQTLATARARGVRVLRMNLEHSAPFSDVFDLVLLDAPCSGLGTLRRDVDIRWRRTIDDVHRASARQRRMLSEASRLVAAGGRLVYATCSSEPEENANVVDAFLTERPDFAVVGRNQLIGEGVPEAVLDEAGRLVTTPDRHGLEIFFAAAIERLA